MLLRQLFEEINKTAVLGWGRGMGHKGHMLLAKAVLHHAQEIDAKAYFVVSRTSLVDPATGQPWADRPTFTKTKDDPLSPEEKLATYRKVFPQNADVFSVATADASTLDKVLVKIARDGFTKVTLIVGELEKDSFSFLTRPDKSGIPPYQKAGLRDLEIISRQDTSEPSSVKGSPDYQEGPRATPMRTVLTDPTKSEEEQFAVWRDAMPDNLSDDEVMDLMNKAKQRMAAVPAAKNAKKAKQAVAEVSLDEGPSLPSTLKSIATNGEPITQLYGKLQAMAKRWVDNNGSLKGFHRNAAGQSAQWFNNFYFNKLQADLYALAKQAPRHAAPLIVFLKDASEDRESRINFTEISRSLPPILFRMGKKIDDESLARFAASWDSRRKEYESYLSDLEDQADGEDDFDEPVVKPEKSKMPGQQNAQAEQIVNDILSKLPKNVAGDIRNAIARAPNKLQALHQELSKRKIQGVAEATFKKSPYGRTAASQKRAKELLNPPKPPEPKKDEKGVEEGAERCPQCGMVGCTCPPGKCKCKPVAGWIPKKVEEHKKGVKAMKYTVKARNPVAKNAMSTIGGGGAGAHKDKKKASKQGDHKHKKQLVDLGESWNTEMSKAVSKLWK